MSSKLFKTGFFILLAVNVALIVVTMLPKQKRPPMNKNRRDIKDEISETLGFNEQQKKTFEELAKAHNSQMKALEADEKKLITQYFNRIMQESNGEEKAILDQIKQTQENKINVTYEHFEDLKKLCNKEQMEQFDDIVKKLIVIIAGQNQQMPPPPH